MGSPASSGLPFVPESCVRTAKGFLPASEPYDVANPILNRLGTTSSPPGGLRYGHSPAELRECLMATFSAGPVIWSCRVQTTEGRQRRLALAGKPSVLVSTGPSARHRGTVSGRLLTGGRRNAAYPMRDARQARVAGGRRFWNSAVADVGEDLAVLIVEDSETDTKLVLRELRRGGFSPKWQRVDTARGLREALTDGRWDLVISDSRVPGSMRRRRSAWPRKCFRTFPSSSSLDQ